MGRLAPRMKVHADGTATVSGIPYREFLGLMTEASLALHDLEDRYAKNGKTMDLDSAMWVRRLRAIIRAFDNPPYRCPYADIPVAQLKPHELRVRIDDARRERYSRKQFDRIMAEIFADAKEID